jgi:hypothetical protein
MIQLIIIIALAFLGIFVHPFPQGLGDFIFRFLDFVLIIYLLFNSGFPAGRKKENIAAEVPATVQEQKLNLEEQVLQEYHLNDLLAYDERSIRYLIDQFEVIASLAFPDQGWIFLKQDPDKHPYFSFLMRRTRKISMPPIKPCLKRSGITRLYLC